MKKRLFLDMDNVLVNFESGLQQIDESVKAEYVDANGKSHYDDIPGIFSKMEPMEGAVETVMELAEVYDVFILSTAPWNNPSAWSDKVKWVKKYFGDDDKNPLYKRMIITHRKDLVKGDYLIDDRGKNGTSEFNGEWIQFGSERFLDWNTVKNYLLESNTEELKDTESEKTDSKIVNNNQSCLKKCVADYLSNRNSFSSVAWILLIIGELFALLCIRGNAYLWGEWTVYGILTVGVLIFALWVIGQKFNHEFKIRSIILTRLLANAIAPQRIGTIYLLLFVIHIGWLTNATMSLFMESDIGKVIATIIVCIIGTIVLIAFFPNGKGKNTGPLNRIVISGISKLFPFNEYKKFNLLPFVRIFQKVKANKIVVVLSDILIKEGYLSPIIYVTEEQKKDDPIKFATFSEDPSIEKMRGMHINQLGSIKGITRDMEIIKKDLKQVLKNAARVEFYNDKDILETIDACEIVFTDFIADYNNYQTSFVNINELVQTLDTPNNKLFFNLTPGTVTMSSVMTLIAVDGDRSLYYYSQDDKIPVELKLEKVNKNQIPLENLLSQALENVKSNK